MLTSSPLLTCLSGSATAEIWHHIDFLRWQPRSLNTTSGFVFVDVLAFRRSKSINKPNFVDINAQHISIYGSDITTSGLEKQTSTILKFYFRFRSRAFSRNLHFILHQPAEFRTNRSSHCENITSYSVIKMAAADAEYYFRFRICWYRCLQKVKVYAQTKFSRHISIDGWDLATSVFEKNVCHIGSLFPVLISTISRNFHVILHHGTEFRPNRSTHCRNMTSFQFFKMAAATAKWQFRLRICWCHLMSLPSEGQSLSANQISSTYLNWWLRYNYFRFWKTNVRHIYFWFRFRLFAQNLPIILHQATEFHPNRNTHCGNMTSYSFLKMAAVTAENYFRFRICWCHCL